MSQVNSSLDSALHDDDDETVKDYSEDGHSYAGTVVRGVLRGDNERAFLDRQGIKAAFHLVFHLFSVSL